MKQINQPSGIIRRNENQEPIKYTVENTGKKITFSITPIYKKSGENLNELLAKLTRTETKKP